MSHFFQVKVANLLRLLPHSSSSICHFANFKSGTKLADFIIRQWSIKVLDFYFTAHLLSPTKLNMCV